MTLRAALDRTLLLSRDSSIIGGNTPTDDQIIEALRTTNVLLVADLANISSVAGQLALVTLFNLVMRLGVSVRLVVPDVEVLGCQAPLRGERLRSGLLDLGSDLLPGCSVRESDPLEPADVAFVLGDTPWRGRAHHALRLSGDNWSGRTSPVSGPAPRWAGAFPIGALAAAGIAAPEAFKYAMRRLGTTMPCPLPGDFLLPVDSARVCMAPEGTSTGPIDLGRVDCVSGGAIINSALLTLISVPTLNAAVRIIEPEHLDVANLNRYQLARLSDCGLRKIDILQAWQRPGISITGMAAKYEEATRVGIQPFAPTVLVGVDDIPTRWAVQREWPTWLGVGATSHFLAVISSHIPRDPCVGCLHPHDDLDNSPIPTISFVSYWAGFVLAVRLLRYILDQHQRGKEQSMDCSPLRLDQERAFWYRPVAARRDCPVGCAISREHL